MRYPPPAPKVYQESKSFWERLGAWRFLPFLLGLLAIGVGLYVAWKTSCCGGFFFKMCACLCSRRHRERKVGDEDDWSAERPRTRRATDRNTGEPDDTVSQEVRNVVMSGALVK
jgi:hypothetical protein